MPFEQMPDNGSHWCELSRRDFLIRTAATASAASLLGGGYGKLLAADEGEGRERRAERAKVVQVRSERAVGVRGVHEDLLVDMLDTLLSRLTGTTSAGEAWRTILRPDDVVALKFNRSGADSLATTETMMRALVRSLVAGGVGPERIVAVEAPPSLRQATDTVAPAEGWSADERDFGSGRDQLAAWLEQVTAIVNVPFLKNHNIAGITCCLKNLSHAVVKHPARFHGNGCSPYIGDIVALPEVREKLRLNIVNGLRVVFEGGPEAVEEYIWNAGILFGGFDPVAIDMIGLQILERTRRELGLARISEESGPPAYLEAAAARGLGTPKIYEIEMDKIKL
jgi:uncharacterized protein (DUF362 family)